MDKKVLVLCTGNSCRSIIAEALINAKLDGVQAYSSGVAPSGKVNPNAKKVLQNYGIWKDEYHSKKLDTLEDIEFDLVVTVCDHANETCPTFSKSIKKVHISFIDPDGKSFDAFEKTYADIEKILLPKVKENLNQNKEKKMKKNVFSTNNGVNIKFSGEVKKQNIVTMVQNCSTGKCECMSDTTKAKIKDMKVDGVDGDVSLKLSGDISTQEIEEALAKSKVLNQ